MNTYSWPLVLLVSLLAGCGGPDGKVTDSPTVPTDPVGTATGAGTGSGTGSATGTATGYVSPTAPVAVDDAEVCDEAGEARIDLLANDSDPNDALDPLSVVVVDAPANGQVELSPLGNARYVHDGSETTSDSFTYTVDDETGETSNLATVDISVTPINDPPEAQDDAFVVNERSMINVDLAANDSDPDSAIDLATLTVVIPPADGSVVTMPDGTVDYQHSGAENAADGFTYTIRDTAGAVSAPALVTVTVLPVNDPPIAFDDVDYVAIGTTETVRVSLNDVDMDDGLDLTSVVVITQSLNGSLLVNPDGSVDYTHDGGVSVADSFAYTIDDVAGATSNIALVDLQIGVEPPAECQNGSVELSTAPLGNMMLCDDPLDVTCEEDFGQFCPTDWHLCTMDEFNGRNAGWTYPTSNVNRALGVIYCRSGGSSAGHFTVPDSGSPNSDLGQDEVFNCYYGSSAPACVSGFGCNEQEASALCCEDSPQCGNGVVDPPEEQCDDGNADDSDACLTSCAHRIPTDFGFSGTNCL